jgi:hypothetical protein
MSATITLAPSAANFRAMPAPKPEPAPVTTAVLPSSRIAPASVFPRPILPRIAATRKPLELPAAGR